MTPLERHRLKNLSLDQIVRYASTFTSMMRGGISRADIEFHSKRSGESFEASLNRALSIARYYQCAREASTAKILVMNPDQARIFDGLPLLDQDFLSNLRLPFSKLWIDFSMDAVNLCDDKTYGILLWERPIAEVQRSIELSPRQLLPDKEKEILQENAQILKTSARWFTAVKFRALRAIERNVIGMNDLFVEDVISISVDLSGALIFQPNLLASLRSLGHWVIHAVNFISSPCIRMERKEDNLGYWRSRAASELCGHSVQSSEVHWLLMKKYRADTEISVGGYHHRFRYDVRGHFKSFTKGRMTGRVLWCPSHQRGLANEIYRPSNYSGITGP